MTSTRLSGRSPISMVSSLSRECSDQAEALEGMWGSRCVHHIFDGFGPKWPEMDTARNVISRRHHRRKRMIQYSAAGVIERRGRGVLDTPLSRGMTEQGR